MKGHIAKKGRRYYPVTEGKDPKTGQRKRVWHRGHDLKRDAQAALTELLAAQQSGTYVAPNRKTLGEFLSEWVETRKDSIEATTAENYRHQLSYVLDHEISTRKLQELNPMQLSVLYAELSENGQKRGPGGLSAKSVRNVHGVISKALGDAVKWGQLARNPATHAELPKHRRREMKTWTADQVKTFLQAEKDEPEFALWVLATHTGMRRGELLGLRWDSVADNRLSITQTLVTVDGQPTLKEPKTAAGRRSIELDEYTAGVLKAHRAAQARERFRAGSAYQDHGLVFCREDGTPEKPDRITRLFASRAKAVGLPSIRFHDLRHSFASLALTSGVHPKIVSERLGHSQISQTLDTYSHVTPQMDRDVAEAVAGMLR